jgi:hypothetical protein
LPFTGFVLLGLLGMSLALMMSGALVDRLGRRFALD